jgi:hypothetical protein
MPVLRVAGACGFWGDRNDALAAQIRGGPVDVVILDYLAEVTMAILEKQRRRDPRGGWARDFAPALAPVLGEIVERGCTIVANAGGLEPRRCAEAVAALAREQGIRGLAIGVVTGDDLRPRLDELLEQGVGLAHLDTGEPLARIRQRVLSANAYLGAQPIAEAIRRGARIVVTGRCTDSALALGPLIARFGWAADDWDRLAAGVVAGHVIECGAQASGGNFCGGWEQVPDLAHVGYPIAEVSDDGAIVITKHPGTGGLVSPAVVKEQLLYEIGDPRRYLTPDVTADFSQLEALDLGADRVALRGATGVAPPAELKASLCYEDGWQAVAMLTFVWPRAIERAQQTERLLRQRAEIAGLCIDAWGSQVLGVDGAHGPMAPPAPLDPAEVVLRVAVRTGDRETARRFTRELAPLVLGGMPGACRGGAAGPADPVEVIGHWPTLVPRDAVSSSVELIQS